MTASTSPSNPISHVNTARHGWADSLRLLCRFGAVGLMLLGVGCSSASKPLQSLPNPFGPGAKDELLHKQVQADSFPTAKQAGL
jgi:hypothetical protein